MDDHTRKVAVLTHYSPGQILRCTNCGVDDIDVLTLDHVASDGAAHRMQLYGCNQGRSGQRMYRWIVRNDYPPGFAALCWNCQWKKQLAKYRAKKKPPV